MSTFASSTKLTAACSQAIGDILDEIRELVFMRVRESWNPSFADESTVPQHIFVLV